MRPYSYSQLSLFQTCPRAWKFRYVDRLPSIPSPAAEQGQKIHEAINKYITHLEKNKLKSDVTWLKLKDGLDVHPDGIELIEKFVNSFVLNLDTHLASERQIAVDEEGNRVDWWSEKAWFRGIIDKIDIEPERTIITDFKTGWNTDMDTFQLQVYAWLVAQGEKAEGDTFCVRNHFIRWGIEKKKEFSVEQVMKVKEKIKRIIGQIEKEKEFPARPCNFCTLCGYIHKCGQIAELSEKVDLPVIDSPEKAKDYAGKLLVVEERLKKVKELLKEWVKENGAIELDNGSYGWYGYKSKKVKDKEALYEKLCEEGLNPLDFVNFDMRKLGKVRTEGLVEEVKKVRFGFKKGEKN